MTRRLTYKQAGVDIEAGNQAVKLIGDLVDRTKRPEVLSKIGGFGGLFAIDAKKYKEPILVSAADGVGTKLKIAQVLGIHNTVGIDLVAMVVNDLVVTGAEPLFFLDYLAMGRIEPKKVAAIVEGISVGCRQAGCALLGGETAEHPGVMPEEDYDLAGFAVGVVEQKKLIDGSAIKAGDIVLGLASSGLHANGFSLVRKVFGVDDAEKLNQAITKLGVTLGEELLCPTRIYVKPILLLQTEGLAKGIAHVTGGGLTENIPRMLNSSVDAVIDIGSWEAPPIFDLVQQRGQIEDSEMRRTFNMGVGMVVVVSEEKVDRTRRLLDEAGEKVFVCGHIEPGEGRVLYRD